MLQRFMHACERADAAAVVELPGEDAQCTIQAFLPWFDGREAVAALIVQGLGEGNPGDWRMVATVVEGIVFRDHAPGPFAGRVRPPYCAASVGAGGARETSWCFCQREWIGPSGGPARRMSCSCGSVSSMGTLLVSPYRRSVARYQAHLARQLPASPWISIKRGMLERSISRRYRRRSSTANSASRGPLA